MLIPKHARRFTGFDDKIIALYARGLTVREIQAFLTERYALKLIWLSLRNVMAEGSRPSPTWRTAMNPFAILYGDRFALR